MPPIPNPVRKPFSVGGIIWLVLGGVSLPCLAGGWDWLLPPLKNPCPSQAAIPAPVVSIQTTYTPRFGWGILGGGLEETLPAGGGPIPSYGLGGTRSLPRAPIVLVPRGGGVLYGSPLSGSAYVCIPYVLPGSSVFYGVMNGSSPSPGALFLPGNLPCYSCVPSTSWHPVGPEPRVLPSDPPLGYPAPYPSSVQPGAGAYSIPARPAESPPPASGGGPFYENPGNSAGQESGGGLPSAGASPGTSSRPLVPIYEEPPPSPQNQPLLNPPAPSNEPDSRRPAQPSFTPLHRRDLFWDRPGTPGSARPDPRDRTT